MRYLVAIIWLLFGLTAQGNPVSLLDPFGLGAAGEGAVSSWLNRGVDAIDNFNADMGDFARQGLGLVHSGVDYMVQNRVGMTPVTSGGNEPGPQSLSVMLLLLTDGESSFLRGGAAEGTGSLRLNIFGEGEAPGFFDTSTSANFANGRPLTSTFGNGSASDIFIRNAPVTGDDTLSEIVRLSQPGTRITLLQPASGFQGQALIDAFGNNASVNFIRTFPSQTVAPGIDMTILRLTVGGH